MSATYPSFPVVRVHRPAIHRAVTLLLTISYHLRHTRAAGPRCATCGTRNAECSLRVADPRCWLCGRAWFQPPTQPTGEV
jgi:hypothetical protein